MAITIDNAFVQQFSDSVHMLAQQSDTKLRGTIEEKPLTGEAFNVDRLGEADAVEKTSRRAATPFVDTPWTRRVGLVKTFHWADTVEHEDEVQMLVDPRNAYTRACGNAMRRKQDDFIIATARADALDGDGVAVPLPGANTFGGSAQALTYAGILEMQEFFNENDVDVDEQRVWVLSPSAVKSLMQDEKIINSDYQKLQALHDNGVVTSIFGGRAIVSNRLLSAGAGRTYCMAYTPMAMKLGVNREMFVRVTERSDLSHAIQVYAAWTMACARVDDERIAFFDHDDAAV